MGHSEGDKRETDPRKKPSSKPSGGSKYGSATYGSTGGSPSKPSGGKSSKGASKGRSSGGSPKGAAPKGRDAAQYRTMLGQLRQQFPFDISKYIEETIRLGQSADYLYARITQSPEFRANFPGIFRSNGTLRYSPGEYQQVRDDFVSTAAQYGFGLSQAQLGGLIGRGVTPKDFEINAKGIQQAKMNPDMVKRLNEQIRDRNANLIRQGKMPIPEIKNFQDSVNFFTGRASQEVYDLYEAAQFATAAGELAKEGMLAGFSNASARNLAAQTAGVLDIDDIRKGFQNVAQSLRAAQVDLGEFGLTDEDLVTVEFGGKDQGAKALRASQALRQAQARSQAQQATAFVDYETGKPKVQGQQEASL